MNDGRFIELVASAEERCRQARNPIREQRARLECELAQVMPAHMARTRRNAAAVWLGSVLVRLGEWLGASSSLASGAPAPEG